MPTLIGSFRFLKNSVVVIGDRFFILLNKRKKSNYFSIFVEIRQKERNCLENKHLRFTIPSDRLECLVIFPVEDSLQALHQPDSSVSRHFLPNS